ncbi:NB-ARC domain-containing protein [Streptomyces sp. TBY4]|nr:NB-ARC domain-containing protein [Streptomyces sp. TBY4]
MLATLLLHANQLVPLEKLINAVWDVAPPTTARAQVQTVVAALRRSLSQAGLGERIRTRGRGYAVVVAPGEIDLGLFSERVAHGRATAAESPETARAAFREALALWRGDPLYGVDSAVVRASVVRVAEQRVEALEECIDVELRLGRHHEVIGEARALVAEHPLRERLARQLITALYRSGRQAEALAVYRDVRRAFIDELGLEPSSSLRQLEHAIITGAAESEMVAPAPSQVSMPVPRMLPPLLPQFTGHAELLGALLTPPGGDARDLDGAEAVQVSVITGGRGAGKSAVAVQAAHELAPDFPDGQLYATVSDGDDTVSETSAVLERLLRALGVSDPSIPEDIDGRAALYRSSIADRRMLILVENVADESQIRWLLPSTPTCRLILTSRARIAALPGYDVFELGALTLREGIELLSAVIGEHRVAAEPSEAMELAEQCGGLPLALRIVAARLATRPHWTLAQLAARLRDEEGRIDELTHQGLGVLPVLRAAYTGLSDDGRKLLTRLPLIGTEDFAAWTAGPLLGADAEEAADVLECLVDARLVDVVSGSGTAARYRLHGLARVYARGMAPHTEPADERREALKRLWGAWLHLTDEARRRLRGAEGTHFGEAPRLPLPRPLVDALLTDPGSWYEQERAGLLAAVGHELRSVAPEYCWNLALAVAALSGAQCRFDDWRSSHDDALRTVRQAQDRLGEAALLYSLGTLDLREQDVDQALVRLTLALRVFEQQGQSAWCRLAEQAIGEAGQWSEAGRATPIRRGEGRQGEGRQEDRRQPTSVRSDALRKPPEAPRSTSDAVVVRHLVPQQQARLRGTAVLRIARARPVSSRQELDRP